MISRTISKMTEIASAVLKSSSMTASNFSRYWSSPCTKAASVSLSSPSRPLAMKNSRLLLAVRRRSSAALACMRISPE